MLYQGESQTFQLSDGRSVGYVQYGPTNGDPVFYFHGLSGAAPELDSALASARRTNTRLIVVDRPGFGDSSFVAERRLYDWPDDIAALADSLHIHTFAVLGVSSGGPYALACAHKLPSRVRRVGISGSLAPLQGTNLLGHMHWLSRGCLSQAQRRGVLGQVFLRWALGVINRFQLHSVLRRLARPTSRTHTSGVELHGNWLTSLRKAYQQGLTGPYYDLELVAGPWGFRLDEIRQPVRIWHGQEDSAIPVAMGRYLVEHLPHGQACFVRGEGHFSILSNYINTALLQLKPG